MGVSASERAFLDHYHRASSRNIRIAAIIGLIIYDLHAVWDFMQYPDKYTSFWVIRFGAVTPVILSAMYLLKTDFGRKFQRAIVLTTALAATSGVLIIHTLSNAGHMSLHAVGFILTMLFCLANLRMLTIEAVIYSLICMYATISILFLSGESSAAIWINNITNVIVTCAIGISSTVLMERYARRAFRDEQQIREEQIKADNLLENTFPIEIARRLKSNETIIADYASQATVMFADVIGFTKASSVMEPTELVQNLDAIFTEFDRLTTQYRCEKIKTIGDAYMVVSGVPDPAIDHAERIVGLALAIQAVARKLSLNGVPISLRIGIHSGPVVAGVIGKSRFAYDLWGDTVNIASRMESTSQAGAIQISAATYQLIRHKFVAHSRGPIEIKGKGMVETWIIEDSVVKDNEHHFVAAG